MLRGIFIGLVIVVVIVGAGAAGGLLLPRDVHVERTVTIQAAPEQIFSYLNDYRVFNDWSPWAAKDPDAVYEYSGPNVGVGAQMSWSGNDQVGTGSQEITVSEPFTHIETLLDFGPDGTAVAFFDLVPVDEGTEVTWGFDADVGMNPVGRYMGLMFDKWVGADYADGLMNLRNLVEDQTSAMRMPDGTGMEPADMMEDDASAKPDDGGPSTDK